MKKTFLILISFLLIFCFSGCEIGYQAAPQITEGEFPFVVEYERNGQRYLIEDTVVCSFKGYDKTNPFYPYYPRTWDASLKENSEVVRTFIELEPDTESVLTKGRINSESRIVLYYGQGGYYLGDPDDSDDSDKGPCINYVENYKTSEKVTHSEVTALTYEQLEEYFGIKIIRFEFSSPIENTFIAQ